MNVMTIGVDLAKNIFQIHGVDTQGKVVLKKKVSRDNLLPSLVNIGPAVVGMEAVRDHITGRNKSRNWDTPFGFSC